MNDIELSPEEILKDLHIVEFIQSALEFHLTHREMGEMGMKAVKPYHRFNAVKSYPTSGRGESS